MNVMKYHFHFLHSFFLENCVGCADYAT